MKFSYERLFNHISSDMSNVTTIQLYMTKFDQDTSNRFASKVHQVIINYFLINLEISNLLKLVSLAETRE